MLVFFLLLPLLIFFLLLLLDAKFPGTIPQFTVGSYKARDDKLLDVELPFLTSIRYSITGSKLEKMEGNVTTIESLFGSPRTDFARLQQRYPDDNCIFVPAEFNGETIRKDDSVTDPIGGYLIPYFDAGIIDGIDYISNCLISTSQTETTANTSNITENTSTCPADEFEWAIDESSPGAGDSMRGCAATEEEANVATEEALLAQAAGVAAREAAENGTEPTEPTEPTESTEPTEPGESTVSTYAKRKKVIPMGVGTSDKLFHKF